MQSESSLRSAEGARKASCEFSDQVARLCVDKFRQLCPADLSYQQTCVAGVVMLLPPSAEGDEQLVVVALGVGTKTAGMQVLREEAKRMKNQGGAQTLESKILRDCHAEVLARRAFKRWLVNMCHSASISSDGISEYRVIRKVEDKYMIDPKVTFHLYSSSQPCGNASVKKWAKGKGVTSIPASVMPKYCFPQDELHPVVHYSAVNEGQIALTVKRSQNMETGCDPSSGKKDNFGDTLPSSIAYPSDGGQSGVIMSCSDKILSWNCVGLQGGLLSSLIHDPVFLSTITIGRKYSSVHGHRAFCCRAEAGIGGKRSRIGDSDIQGYRINHPLVMCTSVKLDEGAIVTNTGVGSSGSDTSASRVGATFDETRSLAAVLGDSSRIDEGAVEIVDSSTGLLEDGSESRLSSNSLHQAVSKLRRFDQNIGTVFRYRGKPAWYVTAKRELKSRLNHPNLGGWKGFYGILHDEAEGEMIDSSSP